LEFRRSAQRKRQAGHAGACINIGENGPQTVERIKTFRSISRCLARGIPSVYAADTPIETIRRDKGNASTVMQATSITIKYDDGSVQYANAASAPSILAWRNSCETLAIQHGSRYAGPPLRRVDCITQVDATPADAMIVSAAGGQHSQELS
jgi:hypothetical protein